MAVRSELMKTLVTCLTSAVLGGIGIYVACVPSTSHTSASRAGFLEADDPPVDAWSFTGGMEDASARRLEDASDVPFLQNKTNTICGRWNTGDRVFGTKDAIDLSQCYAECSKRARCNYFSIAFDGPMEGRCQGCEHGITEARSNFVFFTMKRSDQTTSFSCDDSVTSVDLNTLVDGDRPYELCITEEGDNEPMCYDLRNGGQASASIKSCVATSSSTSTSSTTATTSSSTTTSSTTATTSSSTTTSSTTATTSSSTTTSSTTATASSSTTTSSTTATTSSSTSTSSMTVKQYPGPELIVDGNFLGQNTIGDHNANWVSRQFRPDYKQPHRWWSVNAAGLAQSGYWGGYMYQRVQLEADKTYRLSFDAVAATPYRSLLVYILEAPVTYGYLPPNEDRWNNDPHRPTYSDPANRVLVSLHSHSVPSTPTNAATGFIARQFAYGAVIIDFPTAVDGEYVLVFSAGGDWIPPERRAAVGSVSLRAVGNSP